MSILNLDNLIVILCFYYCWKCNIMLFIDSFQIKKFLNFLELLIESKLKIDVYDKTILKRLCDDF